ncbi:hypothetical protein D5086_021418 [Populus alba]|uniref:Uncharacterized protein n=1 Tax=Populus alba TaxID=43335 RepID=A0ACC4BCA0_POPAL
MESSLPSTQILDSGESAERKNEAKNYSEVMSTLPKVKGWRGYDYYLYQGFCSPKTGTTWLKALTFAILTRSRLSEEEEGGEVQKIISMCSFEELSSLEVNKNAVHRAPGTSIPIQNSVFFQERLEAAQVTVPEIPFAYDYCQKWVHQKLLSTSRETATVFCNSAICIDNDSAKQGSNEAFQFPGLQAFCVLLDSNLKRIASLK